MAKGDGKGHVNIGIFIKVAQGHLTLDNARVALAATIRKGAASGRRSKEREERWFMAREEPAFA